MIAIRVNRYLTLFVLLLLILLINTEAMARKKPNKKMNHDISSVEKVLLNFDLRLDDVKINCGVVRPGQTLARILRQWNIPGSAIYNVALKSKAVFDVRNITAGNYFHIISDPETKKGARYFVYEKSLLDYVVFDLSAPVAVYTGRKPVKNIIRFGKGKIESSLWQTISHKPLGHELVVRLTDLFASSIDFNYLQPGDEFKIIYEEKVIDDKPVELDRILAARFIHRGKSYYAFYFRHGTEEGYFDGNGNSLEKVFLKAPLKYSRISSGFSGNRFHPILKVHRKHAAIDYAAPAGTPVMSVGNGIVLKAGYGKRKGKYVFIRHNASYKSQYSHLSRIAPNIKSGKKVFKGDIIGYVGSTGIATGPHLDFRFWKKGKPVDFTKVDLPVETRISSKNETHFQKRAAIIKQLLGKNLDEKLLMALFAKDGAGNRLSIQNVSHM